MDRAAKKKETPKLCICGRPAVTVKGRGGQNDHVSRSYALQSKFAHTMEEP